MRENPGVNELAIEQELVHCVEWQTHSQRRAFASLVQTHGYVLVPFSFERTREPLRVQQEPER